MTAHSPRVTTRTALRRSVCVGVLLAAAAAPLVASLGALPSAGMAIHTYGPSSVGVPGIHTNGPAVLARKTGPLVVVQPAKIRSPQV